MAKAKLELGVELDILNRDELKSAAGEMQTSWFRELARGLKHLRIPMGRGTVTNGTVTIGGDQADGATLGPREGFAWKIERITVAGLNPGETVTVFRSSPGPATALGELQAPAAGQPQATAAVAALTAAGASVSLPATTAFCTGFDISVAPGTAGGGVQVTLQAGPAFLSWEMVETTTGGGALSIRFPGAGLPLDTAHASATLIAAALTNGGSGAMVIYGSGTLGAGVATWHPGGKAAILHPSEQLVIQGNSLLTSAPVIVTGDVLEVPAPMIWKLID